MPVPPSEYTAGPVSPQQLNTDLYSFDGTGFGAAGVTFHSHKPILSDTVTASPTYTWPNGGGWLTIQNSNLYAYNVIDTGALFGLGVDFPGTFATYHFVNQVTASSGAAGGTGGYYLTWHFPTVGEMPVATGTGSVGAGMNSQAGSAASSLQAVGVTQYQGTVHVGTPYYLDILAPGGPTTQWQPSVNAASPGGGLSLSLGGNASDSSGETSRMGWAWQAVSQGGGTVSSVPVPVTSWGTVTTTALNTMGSALTLLNNPPVLRVSAVTTQSIPDSTWTAVTWSGVTPSPDNYAGWQSASHYYTAQLPGLYLFCPNILFSTGSIVHERAAGLNVTAGTATTLYQGPFYYAANDIPQTGAMVRVLDLKAGDKVQAYCYQNSGGALALASLYGSRMIGAWMGQWAGSGATLTWTAPVTGFRFQAGAAAGTALLAQLNTHLGGDVAFLMNKPYFTGYQQTAQTGFTSNSGFHKITMDTVGGINYGVNGDNYGGWSASSHQYTAVIPGWYLVIADLYASAPSGVSTGVLTAGINVSSSGGITPAVSPDWHQQVFYPVPAGGGSPPGATAIGLYYLAAGESVYPMLQAQDWLSSGTWGTFVQNTGTTIYSQFSCFWMCE